jgi:hypothetical protein
MSAVFVYDAGMLIALEQGDKAAVTFHKRLVARPELHLPIVPLPVLVQVWRPARGGWNVLRKYVDESIVFSARNQDTQLCHVCQGGHTVEDCKRAGELLARAADALPPGKRPDAVDALVVVIGARHAKSVLLTSDPKDLQAYRDALGIGPSEVGVLPVTRIGDTFSGADVLL